MVKIYCKKPIEIQAVQFTLENKDKVLFWCREKQMNVYPAFDKSHNPVIMIPTLEGEMETNIGDYIIVEPFPTDWRKLYPCKPDIFEKTYELVKAE